MIFHGFDKHRDGRDYLAIAEAAYRIATLPTEVTRDEYFYMLHVLPPIHVFGGFLVCEALIDNVYAQYAKRGDRFYAKHVVRLDLTTYIRRTVDDAYPIQPEDAEIAKANYEAML